MDIAAVWLILLTIALLSAYVDISVYLINAQNEEWINAKGTLSLKKFFWCIIMPLLPLSGLGLLIAWPFCPNGIGVGPIYIEQALMFWLSMLILFVSFCMSRTSWWA